MLGLYQPRGGIVALDGLRGLAILLVVLRHGAYPVAEASGLASNPFLNFMVNGWIGVDLFFVLSGFLIGSHVMRARAPHGNFTWGHYMKNRFLRIVPTYAVVVALVVAGAVPLYNVGSQDLGWRLLYHSLFLQDYLPSNFVVAFWSLGVEEKFYLLAPVVIGAGYAWQKHWCHGLLAALLLVVATSIALRFGQALQAAPVLPYQTFFEEFRSPFHACLDALGLGMVAAYAHAHWQHLKRWAAPMFYAGAGLIVLMLGTHEILGRITVWDMVLQPTLIALGFAAMVLAAAFGGGPKALLHAPFLLVNARLSYPLYLLHMTVIPLGWALTGTWTNLEQTDGWAALAAFMPLYAVLAYGAAYGVHVAVEKPFLIMKEGLASASNRHRAARSKQPVQPAE